MRSPFNVMRMRSPFGGGGGVSLPGSPFAYYLPALGDADDGGLRNQSTSVAYPNNLFHYPEGMQEEPGNGLIIFTDNGVDITFDNAAGPNAGERSIRLVTTNTTGLLRSAIYYGGTGDVTIAMEAKAASAISTEFGVDTSRDTINITTSWQTFTKTVARTPGSMSAYWAYRNGGDAYDIEIANLRVSEGDTDLGTDAAHYPLWFGHSRDDTSNPSSYSPASWYARGLIPLGSKQTLSGATFIWAMNVPTTPSAANFIRGENSSDFIVQHNGAALRGYGGGSFAETIWSQHVGDGWSVYAARVNGDGFVIYRNGLPLLSSDDNVTTFDVAYWNIPFAQMPSDARMGPLAVYNEALTSDDVMQATTAITNYATASGLTLPTRDLALYPCGDSITVGGSEDSYAEQVFQNDSTLFGYMIAQAGEGLDQQEDDIDRFLPEWTAAVSSGRKVIVSMMIGRNDNTELIADASDYYDRVALVMAKIKATGAILIMCDILPGTGAGFNTARGVYNGLLATNEGTDFDVHCDFTGVAAGQDGAELNATLYPDGIHPSQTGHDQLAPVFQDAFDAAVALA
ncbi:GDSL-type esterase/lipase family protein [uncultured Maritimibacter sp.]|uniref:SGNH/GDSL hydrolase family protein n=1 Tax=uncultured Maritimibacter sp. TaxID=991866 RepID=UPI0025981681|nr:GDSL-type esterase/lipase family protein [uncultured Maritimibacter sp.]